MMLSLPIWYPKWTATKSACAWKVNHNGAGRSLPRPHLPLDVRTSDRGMFTSKQLLVTCWFAKPCAHGVTEMSTLAIVGRTIVETAVKEYQLILCSDTTVSGKNANCCKVLTNCRAGVGKTQHVVGSGEVAMRGRIQGWNTRGEAAFAEGMHKTDTMAAITVEVQNVAAAGRGAERDDMEMPWSRKLSGCREDCLGERKNNWKC